MVDFEYAEIRKIKDYAKENNIPIMQEAGIRFLTTFIMKNQIKHILEVGTAIGYSAIKMVLSDPDVKVTSIEKDEARYLEALKNIKRFHLEDRITLIFHDALEVKLTEKFDLVFIDAAKAQNIKFFELFDRNLNENGFIITDNMTFHGLIYKKEDQIESRNVRGLVRKIKEYIQFLEQNENYNTVINYTIGDGIAVSKRKY